MQVGTACVDFTPRTGLPLMGNFRDDYLARGVHDPLHAKAMVFADAAGHKAAVLALDVCMLDRQNVALLRRVVAEQSSLPAERVLVCATHTHSAPAPCPKFLLGLDFASFAADVEAFLSKAASAVVLAERDLSQAQLRVGRVDEPRLVFNRRLHRRDGSTQMNWEALVPGFVPDEVASAWGPTDPQMTCLVVDRPGKPSAAIVNYGLHPAILAGDNWLYSADYPGQLAVALERIQGPGFTSLFVNGCCGNINHVDYRDPQQGRGYGMTQRVGYMLAVAAAEAIRTAQPIAGDRVAVGRDLVPLERIPIAEPERQHCEAVLEEARRQPLQGQVDGLPEAHFAEVRLDMYARQHEPDHVEVMALRLGEAALVGLPGEIFCELGLAIKNASPAAATLVAELSNDAIGYIPTRESFAQGGYEVITGSTFYQPGAGEKLAAAAVAQLQKLFA